MHCRMSSTTHSQHHAFIYVDHNGSTPLSAAARAAMFQAMDQGFANPSASHAPGRQARAIVEDARHQVAGAIGAQAEDIIFTSGGSESLNQILYGVARMYPGCPLAISAIEHPAVTTPAHDLAQRGHTLSRIAVTAQGLVEDTQPASHAAPRLAMVMHAHNETGVIQPISALSQHFHAQGTLVGCDAAQSLGKIPVNVGQLDADYLAIAGHKLGAPKGVGALWIRPGIPLPPLIRGAGHERGLRAGSENVLQIAALGAACADCPQRLTHMPRLQTLRDQLEAHLCKRYNALIHGADAPRLPNTSFVALPGISAANLLAHMPQVAASTGSACHAGQQHSSPSLAAMGVDPKLAQATLRFSFGPENTAEDLSQLCRSIDRAMEQLS
ncbi:MAG: cysteine desulfurase [Planctomycetota bacterium]|nr:MAG: cysteine desulfurase [Planctomycetota bacterium]